MESFKCERKSESEGYMLVFETVIDAELQEGGIMDRIV